MPITDPTEQYFKDGTWGWDGSQWRKLPIVWGYSDRYAEYLSTNDATAGNNYLTGTLVPVGEVWVVTNLLLLNVGSATVATQGELYDGTTGFIVHRVSAPASGAIIEWQGQVYLKAGDRMRATFYSCSLGDNLRATFLGYKMKVA